MTTVWTDPPLEMRKATSEGIFAIACLPIKEGGTEGDCCIFRADTLSSAQSKLISILDAGSMGRIYDKDGNPL